MTHAARARLYVLSVFLLASSPAWCQVLVREVTLLDGHGGPALESVDVLVHDGRIAEISTERLKARNLQVVDGRGRFLVPGLIDAHTHPFPVEETYPQFLRYGVTSILVTGCGDCDDETLRRQRAQTMRAGATAPRFFHTSQHFTMEGRHPVKTYPSPKWVDGKTVHLLDSVEEIGPLVERVSRLPIVGIKVTLEDGPDPPFVDRMPQEFLDEIVAQAHRVGTKVLAHVSDTTELRMAQKAGVDHLLHFTGVDIDWDADLPMVEDLRARDVHWVTTIMIDKSFLYPLHDEWIEAVRATGLFDAELDRLRRDQPDPREHAEFLARLYGSADVSFASNPILKKQFSDLRRLHEMGFDLVLGTDVGNRYIFPGYSLHEEMELMAQAGITPTQILTMGTRNAAEMLGALDELGTLEPGKRADMLLLKADPREAVANLGAIQTVFRDGTAVWSER